MQKLRELYGRWRKMLGLPRYVIQPEYYINGKYWIVYDSYRQVHVNGGMSTTKHGAQEKARYQVLPTAPPDDRHEGAAIQEMGDGVAWTGEFRPPHPEYIAPMWLGDIDRR